MNIIHIKNEPNRRQRHRDKKRQSILETALALTLKHGLEGLTMPRLATELDCAVGALYRYFPSKQALIASMQIQILGVFAEQLEQRQQACQVWAEKQGLTQTVAALLSILSRVLSYQGLQHEYPQEFYLLALTIGTPQQWLYDQDEQSVMLASAPLLNQLIHLLNQATQHSALQPGDALERSWLLWSSVQGVMQSQKLLRFGLLHTSSGQLVLQLAMALMRGWGAPESDLTAAAEALHQWEQEIKTCIQD